MCKVPSWCKWPFLAVLPNLTRWKQPTTQKITNTSFRCVTTPMLYALYHPLRSVVPSCYCSKPKPHRPSSPSWQAGSFLLHQSRVIVSWPPLQDDFIISKPKPHRLTPPKSPPSPCSPLSHGVDALFSREIKLVHATSATTMPPSSLAWPLGSLFSTFKAGSESCPMTYGVMMSMWLLSSSHRKSH